MAGRHFVIGGTFNYIHSGHRRLLLECKKADRITVGLTSDLYVKRHKEYPSFSYKARLARLKKALLEMGLLSKAEIVAIDDSVGVADSIDADAIVVSEETAKEAERINSLRKSKGLRSLQVIKVPLVYGESLKKISCRDIRLGRCSLEGRLLAPLKIQAGTENPAKLSGASEGLEIVFGKRFRLFGHGEKSGVPSHPFGHETFIGAKNRAFAAWERARRKCDYALGIESGLFEMLEGSFFDMTVCCAYDGENETYGIGSGFCIPAWIAKEIEGKSNLSEAMERIAGVSDIGKGQGAVGWFSGGKLKRPWQVKQAVANAFVPRIAIARRGMRY